MLNTFPSLLTYSFFAPTLLRIVAGFTLLYIGYSQAKNRKAIIQEIRQNIGWHFDQTLIFIAVLVVFALGLALIVGWYTQIAAIIAILFFLKQMIVAKKYKAAAPLCRLDYFYLIVILLTLLVTGAGAFAFDLPL